jgi:hypothetical protein
MSKLGTVNLKGASGTKYQFDVYTKDTTFNDNVDCVYYVSKRTTKIDVSGYHTAIYVGETGDLKERFTTHHKQSCFDSHAYNCISVHLESSSSKRLDKETDLVDALNPSCNS